VKKRLKETKNLKLSCLFAIAEKIIRFYEDDVAMQLSLLAQSTLTLDDMVESKNFFKLDYRRYARKIHKSARLNIRWKKQ